MPSQHKMFKKHKISNLLGCSNSFFEKWIIHQLYGDKNIENFGSVWTIDHTSPLSKTNLLNEKDMLKITHWIFLDLCILVKLIQKELK